MTTELFTLRADQKLVIAEEIMNWARIRHIPVVDDRGRLAGLVTHRDLLRASLDELDRRRTGVEHREHLGHIRVGDVMATEIAAIDPAASIQAAARLLRRGKFGCLPVVNSQGELLGILTEVDLLEILEHVDLDEVVMPPRGP